MPNLPERPLRTGIFGASGATGTELASLLIRHPRTEIVFATSRKHAGKTTRDIDPAVPAVPLVSPDDGDPGAVDVVFTCLPHGQSARWVEHCLAQGTRVIDLSGDLRLRDAADHERAYGTPRSEPLAARTVYGLTELERSRIRDADVVACPGCYPTCTSLALAPVARAGMLSSTISVFALSGVSGAGRKATAATHFCNVSNDVRPYALGRAHRHVPEIEQTLRDLDPSGNDAPAVVFCPHVIPIERGMLTTIVLEDVDAAPETLHHLYTDAYQGEPFIEVRPVGVPARVRGVVGTNRATIGLDVAAETGHVVITCAIDNLLKGAAGQAVQNMNVMFDLPETMGLGLTFSDEMVTRAALEAIG